MRSDARDPDEGPPAAAVARLGRADAAMPSLFAAAVRRVCAARREALGWREGPPIEDWSLDEARIDRAGGLWLTVHEYETDEASAWMVALDESDRPTAVRRRADTRLTGDPGEAGGLVWSAGYPKPG
ncbi:MAG: hypothetical protein WDN44_10360 [Sphingomonas sp.]